MTAPLPPLTPPPPPAFTLLVHSSLSDTPHRLQPRLSSLGYLVNTEDPMPLVMDLRIAHERFMGDRTPPIAFSPVSPLLFSPPRQRNL